MNLGSGMTIPIPEKIGIWITTHLGFLASDPFNEDQPIFQTRRSDVDQSEFLQRIEYLHHEAEGIEKLDIDTIMRERRDIPLNIMIDPECKSVENLSLFSRIRLK